MLKTNVELFEKTILVTGSPGFIGANLVIRLLKDMDCGTVISFDNLNDYYDPKLKEYRLDLIEKIVRKSKVEHIFLKGDLADKKQIDTLFERYKPDIVVNLAAQAGVRYSIDRPDIYIQSNIVGFFNILEACRANPVEHLVYASSSSVYGNNQKIPFSTDDMVDSPVSLYAATKKSDELMAYCYSKLYDIPTTGLRFFTAYGPAGRPDMFYYSSAMKYFKGETVKIFNYGNMKPDFTYIDDIIEGIIRVIQKAPFPPYSIYNIGGECPVYIIEYLKVLQEELINTGVLNSNFDFKLHTELVGMQTGDIPVTYADVSAFERDFDFKPQIDIRKGLHNFALWFKEYYNC